MTDAQRRYVRTEMAISAAINAVLSIVFLLIVFGGNSIVPVRGWHGLIVDSVPQSLMIALMSTLVPTLLTRKRLATGSVTPLSGTHRWPQNVLLRSITIALTVAIVAGLAHAIALPLTGAEWPFRTIAMFKPLYGACLGAAIARVAVIAALRDGGRRGC